jgi:ElaB/YqjD/DUF883 family membrane-anchored ribosome-binding protein
VTAAQDVTDRAAKEVGDVAQHGQRLIRDANRQIEESTGKPTEAWVNDGSRLIKKHPWAALAVIAVAAYVLGKLRA